MNQKNHSLIRLAAIGLVGIAAVYVAIQVKPSGASANPDGGYDDNYITHIGRSRVPVTTHHFDFVPAKDGGHPDFGKPATMGWGRYMRVIADTVDDEQRPVFRSTGYKQLAPWTNSTGHNIIEPKSYLATMPGDTTGSLEATPGDAVLGESSFGSLFRYTPGLNTRTQHLAEFLRQRDGTYLMQGSFDDLTGVTDTDYTAMLEFGFIHEVPQNAWFDIRTDGEAWMFIDGHLVMDAGWGTENYRFFGGIAADGPIKLGQDARIDAESASIGSVSTNSTAPGTVDIDHSAFIDRDVYVGPEGDPATGVPNQAGVGGTTDALQLPFPMPDLNPPDLGPAKGSYDVTAGAVANVSGDMHVSRLRLSENSTINVLTDSRVLVDRDFRMFESSQINIAPGATLELWIGGAVDISQMSKINAATKDPDQCIIYIMDAIDIRYGNQCEIYAHTIAPHATLWTQQRVDVYGSFIGTSINMGQESSFTIMDPGDGISFGHDVWWPPAPVRHRIDLNRIDGLQNRHPYRVQVFFANRFSQPSTFNMHTNVRTLNVLNWPKHDGRD